MKISRQQLRRIIKEHDVLKEQYSAPEFTPQEQAVIDAMASLEGLIATMGSSNPDMTDYYVGLFRALEKAGLSTKAIAMSV
jgi:hypothetical protein